MSSRYSPLLLIDDDLKRLEARAEAFRGAGFSVVVSGFQDAQMYFGNEEQLVIQCGPDPSGWTRPWEGERLQLGQEGAPPIECGAPELLSSVKARLRSKEESVEIGLITGRVFLAEYRLLGPAGEVMFTPLEVDLIQYLFERKGEACTRDDLLVNVWGYRAGMVTRAVDQTIARLRSKLEVEKANPVHLVSVRGVGYRLVVPTEAESWQMNSESPSSTATPAPVELTPVRPQSFIDVCIGRDKEVTFVAHWAEKPERPLLTLHGTAGVGKTRLALEVYRLLMKSHPDWVMGYVDLGAITDRASLLLSVATALGGSTADIEDEDYVQNVLRSGAVQFLCLDNADGAVEVLSSFVQDLLQTCGDLKILVVRRSRLTIRGEMVYGLRPLSTEDAVALFCERMGNDFDSLDEQDQDVCQQIIHRLDGLPMAIEVVASRAHMFSLEQLLSRMETNLLKLRTRLSDVDERQRSLYNALDWAWQMLSEDERLLVTQCAVFRGSFSLNAIEKIVDQSEFQEPEMIDFVLQGVVDKAWIHASSAVGRQGRRRFEWLHSHQRFAKLQLSEDVDLTEGLQGRHAEYYSQLGRDPTRRSFGGQPLTELFGVLAQERRQIQAAMEWSTSERGSKSLQVACLWALLLSRIGEGDVDLQAELDGLRQEAAGVDEESWLTWSHVTQASIYRLKRDRERWDSEMRSSIEQASEPLLQMYLLHGCCEQAIQWEDLQAANRFMREAEGRRTASRVPIPKGLEAESKRLKALLSRKDLLRSTTPTPIAAREVYMVHTDVVDSTRLWNENSTSFSLRLDALSRKIRQRIQEYDGYEIGVEGDSFLIAFGHAKDAYLFCNSVKQDLDGMNKRGESEALRLRYAAHAVRSNTRKNPVTKRRDYVGREVQQLVEISKCGIADKLLVSEAYLKSLSAHSGLDLRAEKYMDDEGPELELFQVGWDPTQD